MWWAGCDKRRGVRLGRGQEEVAGSWSWSGLGGLDLVLRKMPNFQQLRDWGLGVCTKRNRKKRGEPCLEHCLHGFHSCDVVDLVTMTAPLGGFSGGGGKVWGVLSGRQQTQRGWKFAIV